jgi:diamine N-acetyltransferase
MDIELRNITRENWIECAQFSVSDEQKKIFPIPAVAWMAKSKYEEEYNLFAIYAEVKPVGLISYILDPDDEEYWIGAILIDQKYQQKGYGRKAIAEIVEFLKDNFACRKIKIGYRPDNILADKTYSSLGFEKNGEIIDGETIRCLELTD